MIEGKVSVIIPAFNYGRYLEEAVSSVLKQTYANWEAVIVDDGSTDDTQEIGARLAHASGGRIRYFRLENGGVARARNFGIEQSDGEFIMPLDADDILMPTALDKFVEALRLDPKSGYAYSNLENIGSLPGEARIWLQGPFLPGRIIAENSAASASMWRRSLFEQGVRYRSMIFEDWDLWLQIFAKGFYGAYVSQILFQYRLHLHGRTARNRYLRLPALLEVTRENPSLYDEKQIAWAKSCLVNSPSCWDRCSIVFLPAPGSPSYQNLSGWQFQLAQCFVDQGYFCAVLGGFATTEQLSDGIALLGLGSFSVEAIIDKLGMLGSSIVVLSELPEEVNRTLRGVQNVASVVSCIEAGATGDSLEVRPALYVQDSGFTFIPRNAFASAEKAQFPPSASAQQLTGMLSSLAREEIEKKRASRREVLERTKDLLDGGLSIEPRLVREFAELLTIVLVLESRDAAYLDATLRGMRALSPAINVIVIDAPLTEEQVGTQQELRTVCDMHRVKWRSVRREGVFSRAHIVNQMLSEIPGEWLVLAPENCVFSPDFVTTALAFKNLHGDNALYLAEASWLPPLATERLVSSYGELSELAGQRNEPAPSMALIRRDWLHSSGGLCASLVGAESDLGELQLNNQSFGRSTVWLPTGLLLRPWAIARRSVVESRYNHEVLSRLRRMPRAVCGIVGGYDNRGPSLASDQRDTSEERQRLLSLADQVETLLRRGRGSKEEVASVLLQWAGTCIEKHEQVSAKRALEDAEILCPNEPEIALGMAKVAALSGRVVTMGHYASKVLASDSSNGEAIALLQALNAHSIYLRGTGL